MIPSVTASVILFATVFARQVPSATLVNGDRPMPRSLYTRTDPRRPAFLDASEVIDANGQLRRDAPLSTASEGNLRDFLNIAPTQEGCIRVGEVYYDWINGPDRSSLAKTVEQSGIVLETRVVKRSYGFLQGVPGQLLRLQPSNVLKGSPSPHTAYYIFVPVADFTVGGIRFCKTDLRYGSPPAVGDTLFILTDAVYITDDYIDLVDQAGYIRVSSAEELVLPRSFRPSPNDVHTANELRQYVRDSIRRKAD